MPPQPRYIGDIGELARVIPSETPLLQSFEQELILRETLLEASRDLG